LLVAAILFLGGAGLYVRVEIHGVPCELVENFDPAYPLVLGGLLPSEEAMGYLQLNFKKHRWHRKILKTRDPIILSIGWSMTHPSAHTLFRSRSLSLRSRALQFANVPAVAKSDFRSLTPRCRGGCFL
jgi:hypothetical protein